MSSNYNLKDKIILITGAGDGMGRTAAIEYASQGASVILLGRNVKNLEKTHDIIISNNSPLPMISLMDLSKADGHDYQQMADNLMNKFGHLDGLWRFYTNETAYFNVPNDACPTIERLYNDNPCSTDSEAIIYTIGDHQIEFSEKHK